MRESANLFELHKYSSPFCHAPDARPGEERGAGKQGKDKADIEERAHKNILVKETNKGKDDK